MNKEAKLGVLVWGVIGFLVVGAVAVYSARPVPPAVDEATRCPLDRPPPAQTFILVDKTDPFTAPQNALLARRIATEARRIPRHGQIRIAVLERALDERWVACNPGRREDVNVWIENPLWVEQAFEERFGGPLDSLLIDLQQGTVAPQSPILESIQALARGFDPATLDKRLIVFSDLLENNGAYSQYRDPLSFGAWLERAGDALAALRGVEVEVVYLKRDNGRRIQTQPAHRGFWLDYFQASGAAAVDWNAEGLIQGNAWVGR